MKKCKNVLIGLFIAMAMTFIFESCSSTQPFFVTNNSVGTKVGKASGTCYDLFGIFTLFQLGKAGGICLDADYSIQSAAKNGGITKIATVDIRKTSVLGIVITYETIVTGE
jgi:hypothetical protein